MDDAGIRDRVRAALDESAFRARAGTAPATRMVTGARTRTWSVLRSLRANAAREILSCDDTTNLIRADAPDRIRELGPQTLTAAAERGVAIRQVTTRAGLAADRDLGAIVHRAGGQARVVETIPFTISIIDQQVACLATDHSVLADGFHLVRDPVLVAALVAVHRQLWGTGEEADPGPELPGRLATLVPALASGEPDDVACRRIGLSPRTYSRRVAELLAVLGVQTRFQAGIEATRRGWI